MVGQVYPTLVELAGLHDPRSVGEQINGTSLVPAMVDPLNTSIKKAAYSQCDLWNIIVCAEILN
eukprot:COSAG01_NODE_390_length_17672_cov_8.513287_11_plen_64_part_00